jgi:hypothetical protein
MAELQTPVIRDRPSAALNSTGVRTFPHVWLLIYRWISSSLCLEQMISNRYLTGPRCELRPVLRILSTW